jgi:hypothetical protein
MAQNGKTVTCTDPEAPHSVDRASCLAKKKPECAACPNSHFTIRFQSRIGDQQVACPRWRLEEDRLARREPTDYVSVPRSMCLTLRPFDQCIGCVNGQASEPPRIYSKWWEAEERARKIELELDEEERE